MLTAAWTAFPYESPDTAILTPPGPRPVECGVAHSVDGGKTWIEGTLPFSPVNVPTNPGGCADPALAVGSDGTVYAVFNGGSLLPGAGTETPRLPRLVSFSASHDGGRTWSTPTKVWSFEDTPKNTVATGSPDLAFDRSWIVIDPITSALYVSISDDALVQRVVLVSHDHGVTWSTPYPLDPDGQSRWGDGISGANGVLAAAYRVDPSSAGYKASPSPAPRCDDVCAVFETSTDDGQTWARHVVPTSQVVPASGARPGVAGVQVAADPSEPGRYAVLVPTTVSSYEVWFTPDSGETWTQALTTTASAGDRLSHSWIAFGPTGAVGVVWRNTHSDASYEVLAAISTDGGATFGPPIELTSGTAPPPEVPELGDDCACNLHLDRKYLYTTWGGSLTGQRQVWFARYRYGPDESWREGSEPRG
jgi:hypothetical protein